MTTMHLRRRTRTSPFLRSGAACTVPALAVLLSACGPSTPLKTGLAPVDMNVRLGNYATPAAPPPPQAPAFAQLVAGFPEPFVPQAAVPLPTLAAPPVTPGPACPTAPPFAFPALGAGQTASAPPVAGRTYGYRYTGKYTSGGKVISYPATGTRTIANVKITAILSNEDAYSFDLVESWNGFTTTTSYLVIPRSPSPESVPVANQAPPAGIYLQQQSWSSASGGSSPQVFAPNPMIEVMSFPGSPGTPVGGHGADAAHQASETVVPSGQGPANQGYSQLQNPGASTPTPVASAPLPSSAPSAPGSQVLGTERVDACGTVLDAWKVELIGSYTSDSLGTFTFDDTYDFATEYGGIPIAEHHTGSGVRTDGSQFSFDVTATIDAVPATPSS